MTDAQFYVRISTLKVKKIVPELKRELHSHKNLLHLTPRIH